MARSSSLRGVVVVTVGALASLSMGLLPLQTSRAQVTLPSTWPTTLVFPSTLPTIGKTLPSASPTSTAPLHRYGFVAAKPLKLGAIALAQAALVDTLPATVDLSAEFPPPGDQGNQGSCVGWSLAYAMKSYLENHQRAWGAKALDHEFSPSFLYNQHHASGPCLEAGMDIPDGLDALMNEGVPPISDFGYSDGDCSKQPSEAVKKKALGFKIESYRRVPIDATEVRGQLAARNPIVVGIHVDAAFDRLKGSAVYVGPPGKNLGGHAIAVVGYDDTRQAFRFLNSWGTSWGDGGYAWVSYAVFPKLVEEAYTAVDFSIANPTPKPPTPPTPVTSPPEAIALMPTVIEDVLVESEGYLAISFGGPLKRAAGHSYRIVVRFTKDGSPIPFKNAKYRDAKGLVGVASPKGLTVVGDPMDLKDAPTLTIPHTAVWPAGFKASSPVKIKISYDVYVEEFHLVRSPEREITVRW